MNRLLVSSSSSSFFLLVLCAATRSTVLSDDDKVKMIDEHQCNALRLTPRFCSICLDDIVFTFRPSMLVVVVSASLNAVSGSCLDWSIVMPFVALVPLPFLWGHATTEAFLI